jgi:orotidine-5'-phosphate decarboxylase
MNKAKLVELIRSRKSFLCVGLDTDPTKLPAGVGALEFNKAIIDATREFAVAYKPNLAFYEAMGREGWDILEETAAYIGHEHFTIADAKRGDIGNTSSYYAKAFFETYGFDSITVAPYMGKEIGEEYLFEKVLRDVASWGTDENTMFVVGATKAESLAQIRQIIPNHFLLVPGVGAQGGSLQDVVKYGMNSEVGLLVNASRSILYASSGADYAIAAAAEAKKMQEEMAVFC